MSKWAPGVVSFVLVVVAGWFAYTSGRLPASSVLTGPAMLITPYAFLLVYESGFLLAGIALGYRVERWAIGPLAIARTPEGWRARHDWRWWAFTNRGRTLVTFAPIGLRWRHAALQVSPLAATSALGVGVIAAAMLVRDNWFLLVAAILLVIVASALVPWKARDDSRWSTGLWLWRWAFRPDVAARRVAVAELTAANHRGVRPREWEDRWVVLATRGPARPDALWGLTGLEHGYAAALDRGHVEQAGVLIDRWVARIDLVPGRWQRGLRIEPAFFVARFNHDPVRAAQLVATAGYVLDSHRTSGDLERARAAVHLAAGRPEAALAECEAAASAMTRHPPTGWSMLDRELLESLTADARRAAIAD